MDEEILKAHTEALNRFSNTLEKFNHSLPFLHSLVGKENEIQAVQKRKSQIASAAANFIKKEKDNFTNYLLPHQMGKKSKQPE